MLSPHPMTSPARLGRPASPRRSGLASSKSASGGLRGNPFLSRREKPRPAYVSGVKGWGFAGGESDAENRLVAVVITATGHRSEFGYDGLGRRVEIVEKDKDAGGNLTTATDKKYLWDGTDIAEERSPDGLTVIKRFYTEGFVDSDGTTLLYTRDHLGSVRELTDLTQTVRARYDYDPYGRMTKVSGDRDSVFGFTGHLWHAASGLNLTLFRAYAPELGRWISRDPIEDPSVLARVTTGRMAPVSVPSGEYLDSDNLYLYVKNNSINAFDPFGLTCEWTGTTITRTNYHEYETKVKVNSWVKFFSLLTFLPGVGIPTRVLVWFVTICDVYNINRTAWWDARRDDTYWCTGSCGEKPGIMHKYHTSKESRELGMGHPSVECVTRQTSQTK